MIQIVFDVFEELSQNSTLTIVIGALLGGWITNRVTLKHLKSTEETDRRKHIQLNLSKLLAQQNRLMDRLYQIHQDAKIADEHKPLNLMGVDDQQSKQEKSAINEKRRELVRPISDEFHELLSVLELIRDIPRELFLDVAKLCGTKGMYKQLEKDVEDLRVKRVEEDLLPAPISFLYYHAFMELRKPWMKSLRTAIQAIIKHLDK